MKQIRTFIAGFILAAALFTAIQVSAGVAGFKTDLIAAITANFTVGQRTTISNSFVTAYQSDWNALVAAGTVDNAANRGAFAAGKLIAYVQDIVRSEQVKAAVNAMPVPTPLPN